MGKIVVLSFMAMIVLGCKEKQNRESGKTSILEKGCYQYATKGNTVRFEVTATGDQVLGNLTYAFAEKDKNSGTFIGQLHQDKLLGSYTFQSEGRESTRQVAFQVQGDQLIEGYGELNEDGTSFKDPKTVKYTDAMPLTKVDCNQ